MKGRELRIIRLKINMTQTEFGVCLAYPIVGARQRISELENEKVRVSEVRAMLARDLLERTVKRRSVRVPVSKDRVRQIPL